MVRIEVVLSSMMILSTVLVVCNFLALLQLLIIVGDYRCLNIKYFIRGVLHGLLDRMVKVIIPSRTIFLILKALTFGIRGLLLRVGDL